ncbi:hypothetical protein PCL_11490 [Purpureocillium lilacinum]|uniref:Uncharacterized protein n=1 Tax=Purpureocillium lilacinum TaxID=33203 RepID=A0A2U3EA64_PURLI|nr:hypothetical protein PCL_11490 [Purpureocillium lilacinum]
MWVLVGFGSRGSLLAGEPVGGQESTIVAERRFERGGDQQDVSRMAEMSSDSGQGVEKRSSRVVGRRAPTATCWLVRARRWLRRTRANTRGGWRRGMGRGGGCGLVDIHSKQAATMERVQGLGCLVWAVLSCRRAGEGGGVGARPGGHPTGMQWLVRKQNRVLGQVDERCQMQSPKIELQVRAGRQEANVDGRGKAGEIEEKERASLQGAAESKRVRVVVVVEEEEEQEEQEEKAQCRPAHGTIQWLPRHAPAGACLACGAAATGPAAPRESLEALDLTELRGIRAAQHCGEAVQRQRPRLPHWAAGTCTAHGCVACISILRSYSRPVTTTHPRGGGMGWMDGLDPWMDGRPGCRNGIAAPGPGGPSWGHSLHQWEPPGARGTPPAGARAVKASSREALSASPAAQGAGSRQWLRKLLPAWAASSSDNATPDPSVPAPGQPDKTQHCLGRMVRFSGARKPPFRRPNTGLHIGISISISKTAPRTITSTVRRVSGAAAAPPRQGCAGCPAQPSPAQSPPPEPGKIGCQHEPAPGDGRMDGKDGWATHTPARTKARTGQATRTEQKKNPNLGIHAVLTAL